MISMWLTWTERDIEAYAATLMLPSYLSHLHLQPLKFTAQPESCDGQESLELTYVGDGRVEEYALAPQDHVLAMIRFACPGIETSRIQLPRDDACWHWTTSDEAPQKMRIYFAPTTQVLHGGTVAVPSAQAYVSVSRGHAFIGRSVVESYLKAWFERLGLDAAEIGCEFDTPSAGIDFEAGPVGGQMFLDDQVVAEDLIRFAGLDKVLTHVSDHVELDMDSAGQDDSDIREDGIYISLSQRVEQRLKQRLEESEE